MVVKNEFRFVFIGVYIELFNNKLICVVIDLYRLVICEMLFFLDVKVNCIVLSVIINEFLKLMNSNLEFVYIYFLESYIIFMFGIIILYLRLIEGKYFNIFNFILNDFKMIINVDRKKIL